MINDHIVEKYWWMLILSWCKKYVSSVLHGGKGVADTQRPLTLHTIPLHQLFLCTFYTVKELELLF